MLHVGTARAALFNELFARQRGGEFVLRIEDTDRQRSEKKFEQDVLTGLEWLGLEWNEGPDIGGKYGPYRQSERGEFYRTAIQQLIDNEQAYQAPDSEAIVFKVSEQEVEFQDLIRGKVKVSANSWGGDFIIARSINDPLYHLAAVVDDQLMQISHVVRGEDHLTNTARHILLQRSLGYETPQYAHLPLLLDASRRKLSKRAGDVSLLSYRDKGYLSAAMLNYLALLGWNPGGEEEYFTHEELVRAFSLSKVQKGGAIFNPIKLSSINKHYLQQLGERELLDWGREYLLQNKEKNQELLSMEENRLKAGLKTEQGRLSNYQELETLLDWARPSWTGDYKPDLLIWRKSNTANTINYLAALAEELKQIGSSDWVEEKLTARVLLWIKEKNWQNGDVLWPMRVALTGRENSPGPFAVATVVGQAETVTRLVAAQKKLQDSISGE
jgi:glutamyl/glutaminyl-tRNA synthetase